MSEKQREPPSPRRSRQWSVSCADSRRLSSCSSTAGFLNPGQLASFYPTSARSAFILVSLTQLLVIAAYYMKTAPTFCQCQPDIESAVLNTSLSLDELSSRHHSPATIFYNRVPKCGSETLIELARILGRVNSFTFIHSRVFYSYYITESQQLDFAVNFDSVQTPLLYERHLHFADFTVFNMDMPVYINIIRDPVDRLVSWYYFRRYQPGHMRKLPESERHRTYDDCVLGNYSECTQPQGDSVEEGYFKVIPFFRGQDDFCREPTAMALEKAISNVNKYFSVIGISEQFHHYIEALEHQFPEYFRGILYLYNTLGTSVRDKFATIRKTPPSDAVRRIMVDKLQLEYEFYFFVRRRFEQYYINMKRNERSNKASRSFMNDDIAIMDFA